jgi:hypothetical protein
MAGLPSRTDSDGPGDEQPLPSGPKPPRANGAAIPLVTIATSQAVTSREARVAAGNANTATISVPTAMITLASATDYNSPQLRAVCLLRRVAQYVRWTIAVRQSVLTPAPRGQSGAANA